ncbi:hypothetical protein [Roseovarius sp. 2305UL8-3]|uniref:hypothetical protein n=1 Tax=Roseovarius conchicola TaxID=3121636 RepID=UPI003529161E
MELDLEEKHSRLREEYLRIMEKRRYYFLGACGAVLLFSLTSISADGDNLAFPILLGSIFLLGLSAVLGIFAIESNRKETEWALWGALLAQADPENYTNAGSDIGFNKAITPHYRRTLRLDFCQRWSLMAGLVVLAAWKIASCKTCIAQTFSLVNGLS